MRFNEYSKRERVAWAKTLFIACQKSCENAKLCANIVKKSKIINQTTDNDLEQHLNDATELEMKKVFSFKRIDWSKVVRSGVFIGELYNHGLFQGKLLIDWMNEILSNAKNSEVAVISFLLLIRRIEQKFIENDYEAYEKCMNIVRKIREKKENEIEQIEHEKNQNESNTSKVKGESSHDGDDEELPFNPVVVQAFQDHIQSKIELDIDSLEIFKVSSPGDRQKFKNLVMESAMKNPDDAANFCEELSKILTKSEFVIKKAWKPFLYRLNIDINSARNEEKFWEKIKLFGTYIGEMIKLIKKRFCIGKYKEHTYTFADYWLKKIFKHSNLDENLALKTFKSLPLKTDEDMEQTFLENETFWRVYKKVMKKQVETFPWLQIYHELLNNDEIETQYENITARKVTATSKITSNFLEYVHAFKDGNPQEIFFDHQNFSSKKFDFDLVNFPLQDIELASAYAHFIDEIQKVRVATENFLKHLVTSLEHQVDGELFEPQIDWKYLEKFGVFLNKLYVFKIVKKKLFIHWMKKLHDEILLENENATKVIVQSFHKVAYTMKKRDKPSFEAILAQIVEINDKNEKSQSVEYYSKQILTKYKANIDRKNSKKLSNLEILINKIKSGEILAEKIFEEVSANPEMMENFTNASKAFADSTGFSSNNAFYSDMKEICVKFFNPNSQSDEGSIKIQDYHTVWFIGQLYNTDFLREDAMQTVLMNINSQYDSSILQKKHEAIIPIISDKARDNFDQEKHNSIKTSVHKLIEEFETRLYESKAEITQQQMKFQFPPAERSFGYDFKKLIKKILSEKMNLSSYNTMLALTAEFDKYFIKCAVMNPHKTAIFAVAVKELLTIELNQAKLNQLKTNRGSKFKTSLITLLQKKFEHFFEENNENSDQTGLTKFIGELFNVDVLSTKIVSNCITKLTESSSEKLKELSDILLETITRKVIKNQDQQLLEDVRKFVLERSISEK